METPEPRFSAAEPGLTAMYSAGVPYQWQYAATRADTVPEAVLRAAAGVKIAVIDTGGDVTAPDLAAKAPETHNVFNGGADVRDFHGHGTFVASIAAGSVTNGEGIAGFGGDAVIGGEGVGAARRAELLAGNIIVPTEPPPAAARPPSRARSPQDGR